jgi:hypothetical protein
MSRLTIVLSVAICAFLPVSCRDGTGIDDRTRAVGTYLSAAFEIEEGGQRVDQLARGGRLELDLFAAGTCSGRLIVPGAGSGGSPLDQAFGCSWSLVNRLLSISSDVDNLVRGMPFLFEPPDVFDGERTFGQTIVRIRLQRR